MFAKGVWGKKDEDVVTSHVSVDGIRHSDRWTENAGGGGGTAFKN